MTERLYFQDAYQTAFTSHILQRKTVDGRPAVQLAATLFYPTSGGQMHDVGYLNDIAVVDVVALDDEIWHISAAPIEQDNVTGKLNWSRRFDFMQQHTAFHILAGAFQHLLHVATLASHLGEQVSTIEIDMPELNEDQISQIEQTANKVVWENRSVRAFFVTEEQAAQLPIRKTPAVQKEIRLVEVENWDLDPCGGTHVTSTAQVGLIKIIGKERIRGHLRLTFVAGMRAWTCMDSWQRILTQVGEQLTTGFAEIVNHVNKTVEEYKELRKYMQKLRRRIAEQALADLLARAEKDVVVVQKYDDMTMEDLRWLASSACKTQKGIYLLAGLAEQAQLVFSSSIPGIDLRVVFREILALLQGKGGGDVGFVQGSGTDLKQLDAALNRAQALVRQQMSH